MHLYRIMKVLEAVATSGRPITAGEVQNLTDLPRPTCYRLLQTMTSERLLDEPETGRFLVGERMVRLAFLAQPDADVSRAAAPALKEAADHFGEAIFLSRLRNKGVEIIHVEVPKDAKRSFVHPGLGFRPMHACSCSKVIAAYADHGFRDEILAGPMRLFTQKSKNDPAALRREFDSILAEGYAECVEEIEVGVCSVAAPVQIGAIGPTFSIGATGPVRRFTQARRSEIGGALQAISQSVSQVLMLHGAARV
mgnify:FL=1